MAKLFGLPKNDAAPKRRPASPTVSRVGSRTPSPSSATAIGARRAEDRPQGDHAASGDRRGRRLSTGIATASAPHHHHERGPAGRGDRVVGPGRATAIARATRSGEAVRRRDERPGQGNRTTQKQPTDQAHQQCDDDDAEGEQPRQAGRGEVRSQECGRGREHDSAAPQRRQGALGEGCDQQAHEDESEGRKRVPHGSRGDGESD